MSRALLATANIEGWRQISELGMALVLSAAIGLEREIRQKSAGLRTHTLVGVGAALFMLISKYGFNDVFKPGEVVLDPSRMAAQIVSGVGFLGAGLIFVRRDAVRGLTTAAAIWVTAAIGTAAGADLPVLAAFTTGVYFLIVLLFPVMVARLPNSSLANSVIRVRYVDGRGVLRQVLGSATARGFTIAELATASSGALADDRGAVAARTPTVEVTLQIHGKGSINELAAALTEVEGVDAVIADDVNSAGE
jgi:putative Mg2+ transporter-C (MgtC) family protein